jgi:uncharacterized protein
MEETLPGDPSVITQHLLILLSALIFGSFFAFLAGMRGYFYIPKTHFTPPPALSLGNVVGVFTAFIAVEVVLIPGIAYGWLAYQKGGWLKVDAMHFDTLTQGWLNLLTILFALAAVLLYCLFMQPDKRRLLFWGNLEPSSLLRGLKALFMGWYTWLIAYPTVLVVSQLIGIALALLGNFKHLDQTAVKNLKSTITDPTLLWSTIAAIVFLVPIVEETLFRGFVQRFAIQKIGRVRGIALAALLFASFHFSVAQGIYNIELLLSLFVLGCYLGFIYERQGTLWASIGLHMAFNAISVFMIIGKTHV